MRTPILLLAALAALLIPAVAQAATSTVGIFGDTPYGATQVANFPKDIDDLNADPDVDWLVHVGDIKSGSTQCTDAYFAQIRAQFDRLADPLVYTPGDNEWTDCHRTNNGAYDPLERLTKLREVFFDRRNRTLGRAKPVLSQTWRGLPENKLWSASRVVLSSVHVVGSNDSLAPWTGLTAPTAAQQAEHDARLRGNLEWIAGTFAAAKLANARAVVLTMQADMWDPFAVAAGLTTAFMRIVEAIARHARSFMKPVLLVNGDSHLYVEDQPLAT
ncbi:MAG: metallophosphoesterase, partial [Baekduiaceae bacterium]